MPLARHDVPSMRSIRPIYVSTHMPLARHDVVEKCCVDATEFLLTCLLRGMTFID